MKVKIGWSGETESNVWRKADISLDEGDFARMLREAQVPVDVASNLSTTAVHLLLDSEAEILLTRKLMQLGYPSETGNSRIEALEARKKAIFERLTSVSV